MQPKINKLAVRLALVYCVVSAIWIALSDRAVEKLVYDPALISTVQTWKGWGFVLITGVLLYLELVRQLRRLEEEAAMRRQAEESKREPERRLFTLISNLPGLCYRCRNDEKFTVEFVSDGVTGLTGYPAQDFTQHRRYLGDLIHPEDKKTVWDQVQLAIRERRPFELTYRVVTAANQEKWVWERGTGIFDSQGTVIALEGFVTDITERKLAEAELQRERDLFARTVATAPGILYSFRLRRDGKMTLPYASPRFADIFGLTPAELADDATKAFEFLSPEDAEAMRTSINESARTLQPWRHEWRLRRSGKPEVWLAGHSLPTREPDGSVLWHGFIQDITERRQLEEQFWQSQKLEAIGQLAGGVAHDFNNILAAIMMQAELSKTAANVPEDVREGLAEIRSAAQRAANLTRQLLLFSRRQMMQPHELDLNEVVTSLAKMLQRLIGEDVRLQLHLHPKPLITRADAGMLDQVILNLAVNARDAMPQGGRLLIETTEQTVDETLARAHPDSKPGRYVCLSVSDTGTGIAPEILPRIFEPFFTTKEPGKGTGLGLATVFGIIKQHRGWIRVESKPGSGTEFQIFLPVGSANQKQSDSVEIPAQARAGTETILLAEDDSAVRMLTRTTLERHGYRVLEAANGVEALALWQEHSEVTLLLTDLVMPGGINGAQLARQLQAQKPSLKVVYTSGYSAELAGKELELRTGENFVQKPCPTDQLLETIRRCLDGK